MKNVISNGKTNRKFIKMLRLTFFGWGTLDNNPHPLLIASIAQYVSPKSYYIMKSIRTTCKTSQQYKVKKKSCKYSQEAQYFEGKKKWAMDRWLVPSLALGPPCHNLRESPKLPLMPQRSGFKICPYKPLSLHYCKTQMSPPETRSIYTNLVLFFS